MQPGEADAARLCLLCNLSCNSCGRFCFTKRALTEKEKGGLGSRTVRLTALGQFRVYRLIGSKGFFSLSLSLSLTLPLSLCPCRGSRSARQGEIL